jgi:hypothetical protein
MAEPKAKTLQQRLGFFDEDLKSPVHDDILKWIQTNIRELVSQLYPNIGEWRSPETERLEAEAIKKNRENIESIERQLKEIDSRIGSAKSNVELYERRFEEALKEEKEGKKVYTTSQECHAQVVEKQEQLGLIQSERETKVKALSELREWKSLGAPPAKGDFLVDEVKWEFVVSSQSTQSATGYQTGKNVIGFIDMRVTLRIPVLGVVGLNGYGSERPLTWGQSTHSEHSLFHIYFEAKTRIPNLGELFRQINTYREYVKGPFVVVSPDDKEAELIGQQNIKFIKYVPSRETLDN